MAKKIITKKRRKLNHFTAPINTKKQKLDRAYLDTLYVLENHWANKVINDKEFGESTDILKNAYKGGLKEVKDYREVIDIEYT